MGFKLSLLHDPLIWLAITLDAVLEFAFAFR
jgi:hypothetical protein